MTRQEPSSGAILSASSASSLGERTTVPLLALATFVLFSALAMRPPTGSDARYVEAAREMVESGDLVVPHLAHVPYFEKPILAYWLGAAAQAVFGLSPLAARLPSILATVGSVVATYGIGRELRGPRFGLAGAAVFATMAIVPLTASVLLTDQPLAFFLTLATFAYLRHERTAGRTWIWIAWAALGLAMLSKGPIALVLPATSLFTWLAVTRRLGDWRRLRLLAGLAIVVAINFPWWALVWQRDPRFVDFFFIRMNLAAFFQDSVNHAQGPWYYFATLPFSVFPWTVIACGAIGVATVKEFVPAVRTLVTRRPAPSYDRSRLFLVCMIVPPFLFLTISASKLWYYALPLCPAIALLVADHVNRLSPNGRFLRNSLLGTAALLAAVLIAGLHFAGSRSGLQTASDTSWLVTAATIGVCAVGALIAGALLNRRRSAARGLAVAAAGTTLCLIPAYLISDDALVGTDASNVALRVAQVARPEDQILVSDRFVQDFTVQLAVKRRVGIVGRARELGVGLFAEVTPPSKRLPLKPHDVASTNTPQNPWLYDLVRLRREWDGPRRIWLIWPNDDMEKLRDAGVVPVELARDGEIIALTNRP